MAEIVDQMPGHGGRKYPWNEWLDGRVWKLTKGVDFQIGVTSMSTGIYTAAKVRGVKVRIARRGEVVFIQAIREGA